MRAPRGQGYPRRKLVTEMMFFCFEHGDQMVKCDPKDDEEVGTDFSDAEELEEGEY